MVVEAGAVDRANAPPDTLKIRALREGAPL